MMMRTFLTTVLMLLLGAPCPAWAAAESLLDDEEATKAETLKLLDATGAKARFVSVATINSDQDPDEDILLIDELGTVWLLLNERDCKFAKPQMIAGPVNDVPGPVSLDLSDVDLDNDEDILITNRMGVVYLVVSEGRGRYRNMAKISNELNTASGAVQVRVTDVDLDNDEDIIVGNAEGILYKIENVGMGKFGGATALTRIPGLAPGPYDYVFTDLDFDNDEEIVLIDARETVFLLENLRDRFGAPRKIAGPLTGAPGTVDIEIADYDYDGDDDLIILGATGAVLLLENKGKGVFSSTPKQIAPPLGPEGGSRILAMSDIDAETSEDVVVVNTKGWVFLVENDGEGVYGKPECLTDSIEMSAGAASATREDLNGDGFEDTLILDGAGHLYLVLGIYDPMEERLRGLEDDL
ncbi:MAG: VCBS repeat-containing protein [Candidatus Hydrogenedentes bacterium]|nr:VCBS repeat-containing protein [Candidatus Hydrogenedentota bacterium]